MTLLSVSCNHCGAPLEISEETKFVTCRHCHRQLAVKHSDSSFFTEVLTQLAERTADMADDLKIIQLQNDLERLDREWEAESREYMVKGKNGHTSRPSPILITIIGGGMLVIGLATLFSSNDGFSSLFMLTFVGVVAFIIYSHWHKHSLLSTREEQYLRARAQIVHAMDRARQR
jgi:hypothetical protein